MSHPPVASPRPGSMHDPLPPSSSSHRPSPPPDDRPHASSSHTSLPSIRHLHPYLPPPSSWSQHPEPAPTHDPRSPIEYHSPASPAKPDDAAEDTEQSGPPKKKRRRQALNCTECKRRKIRCDRSQPCGPCTRRGEPAKCQWHVFEPVSVQSSDKYVTRAEYDDLKARVEELESIVRSFHPSPPAPPSAQHYHPIVLPSADAVPPYHQYPSGSPSAGPTFYHHQPLMPPPPTYARDSHHSRRPTRPDSPRSLSSKRPRPLPSPPPPPTPTPPASASLSVPSSSSSGPIKSSPHSLAAITIPYDLEPNESSSSQQQSKNCRAQILNTTLGGYLRPTFRQHQQDLFASPAAL